MHKSTPPLTALALLLAFGLQVAPAHAQLSRTFVSAATGSDGNNCDRSTPCRTFQGAHDKTNDQGEIVVLDPGGYGSLTIGKAISIVNDGVGEASILVSGSATGITVIASGVSDINLRGITVQGIGFGGGNGLLYTAGRSLTITNCVFRNLTGAGNSGNGIVFAPANGTAYLAVIDTLVADNGGFGIEVQPVAQMNANVALRRVNILNNGADGLVLNGAQNSGTVSAMMVESATARNGGNGIFIHTDANRAAVELMALRSTITRNGGNAFVVSNSPNARMFIGQSSVIDNAFSWDATGGAALFSFGDNEVARNSGDRPMPTAPPI